MIAAVLCVVLFSGRLAASEKSFSYGGQAGGGRVVQTAWSTDDGQSGFSQFTVPAVEILPKPPLLTGPQTAASSSSPTASGYEVSPLIPAPDPPRTPAKKKASTKKKAASGYPGTPSSTPASAGQTAPANKKPAAGASTTKKQAAAGHAAGSGSASASASTAASSSSSSVQPAYGLDPAGEPEYGLNQKAIDDIVREHNVFRAREHVPPLTWNATLAKFSQEYAETKLKGDCQMVHSTSPYGENLMQSTGGGMTWKTTVDEWSDEKKSYHYGSNTCDPGKMCGHYTAVVWKGTTTVGCGRVRCNNGGTMLMCSYWPAGNYEGVKPF